MQIQMDILSPKMDFLAENGQFGREIAARDLIT